MSYIIILKYILVNLKSFQTEEIYSALYKYIQIHMLLFNIMLLNLCICI